MPAAPLRPPLLSAEGISKQFGARPLFENLAFALYEGDRVGLVGPNGSGKSTLLRILAGVDEPDAGTRSLRKGVRIGYVPQDPLFAEEATAEEVVMAALAEADRGAAHPLEEYERAARAAIALGRVGFRDGGHAGDHRVGTLSGGWRKRLAIARELAGNPDVLLMDEPTNHLDLEGILELEELLASQALAYVVVSHDRYFLERVARRMIELDRVYPAGLLAVDGTYSDLLEQRDVVRREQEEYQATLANRARREVEWLRRGAPARTAKAKARIDSAGRLLGELAEVRERTRAAATPGGKGGLDFGDSGRKTKRLLEARGVGKSFEGRPVLQDVDLLLRPGARLGVIGPNGSGKTTLLSLLAGTLDPDEGTIVRAPLLRTVLFEQGRASLDPSVPLRRALAPEGDSVIHQDRAIHVASWAARFLFRAEQLDTPVGRLSGGEQARVLLARLMLQPADLLILDEPTDDLDIPTLEVLEESLLELAGALVLVTHDRYLLDRVATSILALERAGEPPMVYADTAQWEAARRVRGRAGSGGVVAGGAAGPGGGTGKGAATAPGAKPAAKKLKWKEQQEWDRMEATVVAAEAALGAAEIAAAAPGVQSDAAVLVERCAALESARAEVERLYARWAELEAKRGGA